MYCTECGTGHEDTARLCVRCGAELLAPLESAAPGEKIESYLGASIVSTLCCCIPFGIPAIIYATQVNGRLATGNVAGAREASRKARLWVLISFGLGLAFWVIYFAVGLVGGALGDAG